jgi:tetratricopeptide (TPR) repeat protein
MLIANVAPAHALARVVAVRDAISKHIGEWSHAQFLIACNSIERLFREGNSSHANAEAQGLLDRCLQGGERAYPGAAYDIARAFGYVGRALRFRCMPEAAMLPLAKCRRRFEELGEMGDREAARMASNAMTDYADCLCALGRLDEAAAAYEEAVSRFRTLGDRRGVAVARGQIGIVRGLQGELDAALAAHQEARGTFESLGEWISVAIGWQMIGKVHRRLRQFDQAEAALRESLVLFVRLGNAGREATTLMDLGILYDDMGQLVESVNFSRQAGDKFLALRDTIQEGMARSNAADTLVKLGRYEEARLELRRAMDCKGANVEAKPWKTWNILHDLERAVGNAQEAASARKVAIKCFLGYRRDGGENHEYGGPLCQIVGQAIEEGQTEEAEQVLLRVAARSDLPDQVKLLIPRLQAILRGHRDVDFVDDPRLWYTDSAELGLLFERLVGDRTRPIGSCHEGGETQAHLRDHRYADFRRDVEYDTRSGERDDEPHSRSRNGAVCTEVETLIEKLNTWELDDGVSSALISFGELAVPQLGDALLRVKAPDPEDKDYIRWIAYVLQKIRHPSSVAILRKALTHDVEQVRFWAALVLNSMHERVDLAEASMVVKYGICHRLRTVRVNSCRFLGDFGEDGESISVGPLIEHLKDHYEVRDAAIWALREVTSTSGRTCAPSLALGQRWRIWGVLALRT